MDKWSRHISNAIKSLIEKCFWFQKILRLQVKGSRNLEKLKIWHGTLHFQKLPYNTARVFTLHRIFIREGTIS